MNKFKRIINTPFPRATLIQYVSIAVASGFIVNFILIVFQPFGTASFRHEQKVLILSGYGVTVSVALIFYYLLSLNSWGRDSNESWTILGESLDLLFSLIFSVTSTYFYALVVLGFPFLFSVFKSFMAIGLSVAFFPAILCLAFLYMRYKDVIRLQSLTRSRFGENVLELTGTNQNEKIVAKESEILYLKANDNYVMIVTFSAGETKRYMLRTTLKKILKQLNSKVFSLCHRSFIVNEAHIVELLGNKSSTKLRIQNSDQLIPISRTLVERFRNIHK